MQMSKAEAIGHIKDVICENNTIKPNMVVFEQEKEALCMAIEALKAEPCEDRMKYVQETVNTMLNACTTNSIKDKVFRNAARFVQNAIDGKAPDFEKIDEPEPCEDAVSREAVIDALDKHCDIVCEYSKKQRSVMCGACPMGTAFDVIDGLPSVQPTSTPCEYAEDCKKMKAEPCEDAVSKAEPCDAVSREAVLEITAETGALETQARVKTLPSVTLTKAKGKWIKQKIGYGCSNCTLCTNDYGVGIYKFCPNCGADMREGE